MLKFLIIFITSFVFSQTPMSGKISYKIEKKYQIIDTTNNNHFINKIQEAQVNLEFQLLFNHNSSLFQNIPKLIKDGEIEMQKIITSTVSNDFLYFLNNDSIVQKRDLFGKEILEFEVKKPISWKLINETKKVGAFLCYKATTEVTIIRDQKPKTIEIIAWYCPEIPFPYGPQNYRGLPGIILELTSRSFVFTAKKIEWFEEDIIKKLKPWSGKMMSTQEVKKFIENRKTEN